MAPGQGACDDCGAVILVLFTTSGHLTELDPEPVDDGTRIIVELAGLIRVRTLTGPELPHLDGDAHRIHRCPEPDQPAACAYDGCRRPDVPLIDGVHHPECHPEVTDKLLADQRARIARQFKPRRKRGR